MDEKSPLPYTFAYKDRYIWEPFFIQLTFPLSTSFLSAVSCHPSHPSLAKEEKHCIHSVPSKSCLLKKTVYSILRKKKLRLAPNKAWEFLRENAAPHSWQGCLAALSIEHGFIHYHSQNLSEVMLIWLPRIISWWASPMWLCIIPIKNNMHEFTIHTMTLLFYTYLFGWQS